MLRVFKAVVFAILVLFIADASGGRADDAPATPADVVSDVYHGVRARDEITESKEKNPAAGKNAGKESGVYA